jgi:hypothetical protein
MTRRILRLGLAVGALLLVAGGTAPPAWAACALPQIDVTPSTVKPGDEIVITGRGFMAECRDTIMPTTSTTLPPVQPIRGIEVVFEQSGRRATIATVDANADFSLTATVRIPDIATDGTATIILRVAQNDYVHADIAVVSDPSGELARTGVPFLLAFAGAAAFAVGLGLSFAQRRHKHA